MLGIMAGAHGQKRHVVAVGIVLAGILLPVCPCGFALNPTLDVSQYAHTAWKIREGFPKGQIVAMAQTPDGYLWLGTEFGLVRFDGVRGVPWQPPANQHLPSNHIFSLLAARDGTLWIGTFKGLASWKDGKLTQYPQLDAHYIFKIIEDHEGSVWVSGIPAAIAKGKLCAFRNGSVQCYGQDGSFGRGAFTLYEDSRGNLWAGVEAGVWRWKPDPPKFYPLPPEPDGIQGLGEDEDGALLIGSQGGLLRLVGEKTEPYPLPGTGRQFRARRLLRDRNGSLWIGTSREGLLHVHQGRTDAFASSDSLSDDDIYAFFEDREGNIWVSTPSGLDRFRDSAVATLTTRQGLLSSGVASVLADRDGSVWIATREGLNKWTSGQMTTFGQLNAAAKGAPRFTTNVKRDQILAELPQTLFQDDRGRIWCSTRLGFGYLENDRYIPVSGVPGGPVTAITQDTAGNLWVSNEHNALFQLFRGNVVQQIPWSKLGRQSHASALVADPLQGGIWIGFGTGGIAYFSNNEVRQSYAAADGLGEGRVNFLRFDRDRTLWAGTDGGLSRLKNGRVATLSSKSGLPCDTVHWVMEDDADSFWLYMPCGLVRIARSEVNAWAAAVDQNKDAKLSLPATVFDSFDGVKTLSSGGHFSGQVAKSSDGKLWFLPWDGVSVVDPRHLSFNKLPPPVQIERVTADRKTYDANSGLRLPPLVRDLQIDYTALSLAAPEKVLFRYKLESRDRDWQDATNRRQTFYNDLPPGNYRFRVMACNNSGVWNEAGAFLNFSIAPAYYQTKWFSLLCAAASLALLAALYQLRLRQVARQFNLRMEERVNERTRIARDFHDTLLQSFQGVVMKFHAVTYLLPDRPVEAQNKLETVVEQARQAIAEGRDAVQGLRSSTVIANDLAQEISAFGQELTRNQTSLQAPDFCVRVEGTSRDLAPLVRDEVYRVGCEAVRNAFGHAQAERIEVEIQYGQRQLRLRVRDDGKGIDPKVLSEGGRAGHHGLPGMQERAKLVGGKLAVLSEVDSGTEVELTIPAALAYAKSPLARRWMFSRKETS
jgi:signal transduction histidine kinase/ligand-binding sensor domain-containing protein